MAAIKSLTENEVLKLKATVLYILDKCGELDYLHLFKILYFADREHYAKYGRRIIQDTFCALKDGPVPSKLYDAMKGNQGTYSTCTPYPTYYYIQRATACPDMDELSRSDIEMLDKSIKENISLTYSELSSKSHDIAWEEAWNAENNSAINPFSMAMAGGANEAMMCYIREHEEINSLLN
jgi:Uncharacterized phage-associated protein